MPEELRLDPLWRCETVRTGTATKYSFPAHGTCPGYSFNISYWRLRKDASSAQTRSKGIAYWLPFAIREIERQFQGKMSMLSCATAALRAYDERADSTIGEASRMSLCLPVICTSPELFCFCLSIVGLMVRDGVPYVSAKDPWPSQQRPDALLFFPAKGFIPGIDKAAVATTAACSDAWIISDFSGPDRNHTFAAQGKELDLAVLKSMLASIHEGQKRQEITLGEIEASGTRTRQDVEAMRPHVEGVPPLLRRAEEALEDPLAAADEFRRQWPLNDEETIIRDVMVRLGSQKDAARELRMSEPTMSRRCAGIRKKMIDAGYPSALVFRPSAGHKLHIQESEALRSEPVIDIESPEDDWRTDSRERERIIQTYCKARTEENRQAMRDAYPDIEAEAEEFVKQQKGT